MNHTSLPLESQAVPMNREPTSCSFLPPTYHHLFPSEEALNTFPFLKFRPPLRLEERENRFLLQNQPQIDLTINIRISCRDVLYSH